MSKKHDRGRLHFLGLDAQIDPSVGRKLRRGIYASDRIHMLVVGFPGCGKTRFLLSLIKQHIDHDEGFMVIDSHRDLAPLVLSHIPPEKWNRVVYINPWTAFEKKYGNRVVQVNFLEYKDPRDRDVIARLFMDSLEKIYQRWWGPRLDMILMNALYLLMEKESAKLPELYKVIADEDYREVRLSKCRDDNVKSFWENEYKRMPKEANVAVLTKIYRLVQERIVVPMFMAGKSSIDFREAMDQGKFIIVDLPEGRITSDIANFIGCLILARIYLAGMSREDIPEEKRRPFYVYIDEAYRYTTKSISEILQSLRKYKVFMTLASQFLGQYIKSVQQTLPHTCETIVCFTVGEETARALEKFYPKEFGFTTLMSLPRHFFFASSPFCGVRECQILEVIDPGRGDSDPDDVIRASLERYGREVDPEDLLGKVKAGSKQEDFLDWPVTPAEWNVLLKIRLAGGRIDEEELLNQLVRDKKTRILRDVWVAEALKNLSIETDRRRSRWVERKNKVVTYWRDYYYSYGKKEVKPVEIEKRIWYIHWGDEEVQRLLDPKFSGSRKAGGIEHVQIVSHILKRKIWPKGWIAKVDTGEYLDIPDIIVSPTRMHEEGEGLIDPKHWDYERSFAVEIEIYPERHWDRVKKNYERNRRMGFPTVFVVPSQELKEALEKKLGEWGIPLVESSKFEPNRPELACVDVVPLKPRMEHKIGKEETSLPSKTLTYKERPIVLRDFLRFLKGYKAVVKSTEEGPMLVLRKMEDGRTVEVNLGPYDDVARQIVKAEGVEVMDEDQRRSSIREFKGMKMTVEAKEDGKWLCVGTAKIPLCPYDEVTEAILREEGITVEEAPTGEEAASQPIREAYKKPGEEPTRPTKEEKHSPITAEKKMEVDKRKLIQQYVNQGYTFRIKIVKGHPYLQARKWSEGKLVEKSLGRLDEETKQIIRDLGLKVRGL